VYYLVFLAISGNPTSLRARILSEPRRPDNNVVATVRDGTSRFWARGGKRFLGHVRPLEKR